MIIFFIGVNAIWPATPIATAAVEMLGGDSLLRSSRTPEIMADAAYAILCRDPAKHTGNFYIDEEVGSVRLTCNCMSFSSATL